LLARAVTEPGTISAAYSSFHGYSLGNRILAMVQCLDRGITPGPLATFPGWKARGRYVRKGEKALTLCMPVTVRCKQGDDAPPEPRDSGNPASTRQGGGEGASSPPTRTCFVYRPHWFVLSQTEGAAYAPAELPQWSESRALAALHIERVPFRHADGNAQGYAVGRQVAVSPIAFAPARTLLHELAHVVLGHTEEVQKQMEDDDSATPRDLREVEAECVALIGCSALGLGGEAFSRGYIQHWLKGKTIPERSAQKVFKAADQILRAGRPAEPQLPASIPFS
jgi:hypothetical protein